MDYFLYNYPVKSDYNFQEQMNYAFEKHLEGISLDLDRTRNMVFDMGLEYYFETRRENKGVGIYSLRGSYDLIRNNIEHTKEVISSLAFLREIEVENLDLTITKVTGSKNIREPEYEDLVESLKRIMVIANKFKINLILHYVPYHIVDELSMALKLKNRFLEDRLYFALDVYRLIKDCHIDPRLAFTTLEDRVKAILFKLNYKDDYRKLSDSSFDFRDFLSFLESRNFKGSVIFEGDENSDAESVSNDILSITSPPVTDAAAGSESGPDGTEGSSEEQEDFIPY